MESLNHISWNMSGSLGTITIQNPPENYIAEPELVPVETMQQWTSSPDLKGILIHGEGRHFSAGGDLSHLLKSSVDEREIESRMAKGKEALQFLRSLHLPLVAAIKGVCFGAGLELALACHIRVCSENALFAFPEVNRNVIPGYGGTVRAVNLLSSAEAVKLILGGDIVTAEEALRTGLVGYVVPKENVIPSSMSILERLTRDRPVEVIRAAMEAIECAGTSDEEEAMKRETALFAKLAYQEAIRRRTHES